MIGLVKAGETFKLTSIVRIGMYLLTPLAPSEKCCILLKNNILSVVRLNAIETAIFSLQTQLANDALPIFLRTVQNIVW